VDKIVSHYGRPQKKNWATISVLAERAVGQTGYAKLRHSARRFVKNFGWGNMLFEHAYALKGKLLKACRGGGDLGPLCGLVKQKAMKEAVRSGIDNG